MKVRQLLVALSALFMGCLADADPKYRDVLIPGVPHVRQKPDFCGEACAEMYLRKLQKNLDQDAVFGLSGLDPAAGRGCWTRELATALRRIGFDVGRVWHQVPAASARLRMEAQWKALHGDLLQGVPSIVCMHYAEPATNANEHFRLVLGYEAKTDEVIYHEPALARGAYRRMNRKQFMKLWPLKYRADKWTVIRFRLEAGRLRGAARQGGFSRADYAQHIMKLKQKVPSRDFHVVVQPPFVVIGDGPEARVRRHATGVVKWTVDLLRKGFFERDPQNILDIWLFKDKRSYEKNVARIFGEKPGTPFGYYSERHRALIMNIATGGGTLVHEIVHPFMASNFPACPAWFNEGLASLYEQCRAVGGHIRGLTNWRLAGLQRAIRAGHVPSFKTLTGTNRQEFYGQDPGTNYSQARYLCYYLQEKGLLVNFYKTFAAGAKSDPTGYKTLRQILGEQDLDAFQKKWEAFILKLTFP